MGIMYSSYLRISWLTEIKLFVTLIISSQPVISPFCIYLIQALHVFILYFPIIRQKLANPWQSKINKCFISLQVAKINTTNFIRVNLKSAFYFTYIIAQVVVGSLYLDYETMLQKVSDPIISLLIFLVIIQQCLGVDLFSLVLHVSYRLVLFRVTFLCLKL